MRVIPNLGLVNGAELENHIASYCSAVSRDIGDELIRRAFFIMRKATHKSKTRQASKASIAKFWRHSNRPAGKLTAIRHKMKKKNPKHFHTRLMDLNAGKAQSARAFLRAGWLVGMYHASKLPMIGARPKFLTMKHDNPMPHMISAGGASASRGNNPQVQFFNAVGRYKRKARRDRNFQSYRTADWALGQYGKPGLERAVAEETAEIIAALRDKLHGTSELRGLISSRKQRGKR